MDEDEDQPSWLSVTAVTLGVLVFALAVVKVAGVRMQPEDDGMRPVYVGHCGGIDYRWHYDPRTVPSGASCVVERIER